MRTWRCFLVALVGGLLASACGFVTESDFLPRNYSDPDAPTVVATPADGSKVAALAQVDLAYSESVVGADIPGNYALTGAGVGTLAIGSVSDLGGNTYRLLLSGTSGDGAVTLSISNVTDVPGNALAANTIGYTGWWNTSWQYRRRLSFDNSARATSLLSFPVLARLNSSRISYAATQDLGQDIRFLDPDRTVLAHEIEAWNESGDSLVWVRVPQIDGGSTTDFIWMYYGNAGAPDGQNRAGVWEASYIGVWHLNESSGTLYDSTANARNGTREGTVSYIAGGVVAGAQDFDAGTDRVNIALPIGATVTISAWAKLDVQGDMLWCIDTTGPTTGLDLWFQASSIHLNSWDGAVPANLFCPQPLNVNQWHHYATVLSAANTRLYIDGVSSGTTAYKDSVGTRIYIGSIDTAYTWDGSVDELRLSSAGRSADWISADYASMNGSLLSFGSEE